MKLFGTSTGKRRNTRAQRVAKLRAKVKKARRKAELKAEEEKLRGQLAKYRG